MPLLVESVSDEELLFSEWILTGAEVGEVGGTEGEEMRGLSFRGKRERVMGFEVERKARVSVRGGGGEIMVAETESVAVEGG